MPRTLGPMKEIYHITNWRRSRARNYRASTAILTGLMFAPSPLTADCPFPGGNPVVASVMAFLGNRL